MTAIETGEQPDDEPVPERLYELIGVGQSLLLFVVFTAVGWFVFESLEYGALTGVIGGTGSYLFLSWFLQAVSEGDEDDGFAEASAATSKSGQFGVTGLGLEIGAIFMFVAGFVTETPDLAVGIAIGLLPGMVGYIVGGRIFQT